MSSITVTRATAAAEIPLPTRDETERLAHDELARFVALLEQLDDGDWTQPTACERWTVRDVAAHQGAHVEAGMGVFGTLRQFSPRLRKMYREPGMSPLDEVNEAQVGMRRNWPVERIVGEIREGTPRAIASRRRMPWPARHLPVPVPDYGVMSMDRLLHVIYPRDMWIHRLDIADATGRTFELSDVHDGALLAQAIRDMDRNVRKGAPGYSVLLEVDGAGGGLWRLGKGDEIRVSMELPAFLRASSRRVSPQGRSAAADVSTPDPDIRERVLNSLVTAY